MSDLYLTFDWRIRPGVNYVRLVGLARELGCTLAIAQANIVTPQKTVLIRFALRVPSQVAFQDFLTKGAAAIGLDHWQTVDEAAFAQAQPLDLHLLDTDFLTRWMDAMHAYGRHNAALLKDNEQD
jgi:hypothetical protein